MMALPNPTKNVPRLYSRPFQHIRSPSRSPVRGAVDFDPLLSDLSPTRTLHAFADEPSTSIYGRHDAALSSSIGTASPSERALGTRAAQTCINLRSWCRELENWEWPGTFEVPEPERKRIRPTEEDDEDEHWGSLPARTVLAYDRRVDELCKELDSTDVEDLKEYVLSAHQMAGGSIDDSFGSIGPVTDLRRLDDFTAIVTATILQALPYLSRLHRLLDTWTIRLSILRQAPRYLDDLQQARIDLDRSWAAIGTPPSSASPDAPFTRDDLHRIQDAIHQRIMALGRRLDSFLDELEGRQETVPETWIDEFERLEAGHTDWVVQAERKVLENEWRSSREEDTKAVERLKAELALAAAIPGAQERKVSDSFATENHATDEDAVVAPSSRPSSDIFYLPADDVQQSEPYLEPTPDEQETPAEMFHPLQVEGHSINCRGSPKGHDRHVPIVTDFDRHISDISAGVSTTDSTVDLTALPPPPPPPATEPLQINPTPPLEPTESAVKRRAAFFNGDLERTATLQRAVKSPVRPFEHASNAFTRLFKRDKAEDTGRFSGLSQRSASSKRSAKGSKENINPDIPWGHRRAETAPQQAIGDADVFRSRNTSQRGKSRERAKSTFLQDSGLQRINGRGVIIRDYPDLPGGFRPRSRSEDRTDLRADEQRPTRFDRPAPETYRPKRLESPFRPPSSKHQQEPEYPSDWPLTSPPVTEPTSPEKEDRQEFPFDEAEDANVERDEYVELRDDSDENEDSGPDIRTPEPIETSSVDRILVSTFPAKEIEFEGNPLGGGSLSRGRPERFEEPTVENRMPDLTSSELNTYRPSGYRRDTPRGLPADTTVHKAHEAVADALSRARGWNQNSAKSLELRSGSASPAQESDETEQNVRSDSSLPIDPALKPTVQDSEADVGAEHSDGDFPEARPGLLKRASVKSIESYSRADLRSIDLSRRRSDPSVSRSAPQTPREQPAFLAVIEDETAIQPPASPMSYDGSVVFPSPPRGHTSMPASPVSPMESEQERIPPPTSRFASLPLGALDDSPQSTKSSDEPQAPLNVTMSKRRDKTASHGSAPAPPRKSAEPLKPGEDTFDRHVSEVLQRLPSTSIRFKPRAGAETPVMNRTAELRGVTASRPKYTGRASSRTSHHAMTLAPAEVSPKKTESEVKLYHLMQAGREEPIKLFVRLVGDPQRVMVRVGGGWADLAEYLRQYAEHHGSRTVSGGGLELHTPEPGMGSRKVSASSALTADPKLKSTGSSAVTSPLLGTPPNAVPRPESRLSVRADNEWLDQSQPDFHMGDSTHSDNRPVGPLPHITTPSQMSGTQRSTPSNKDGGSRPSTADSGRRPGSKQSWTEAGLAGPGSVKKTVELSEQKHKWVEGMLEKAKLSAEKDREDRARYFGELGKAGGTRRVIFRSSGANDGSGAAGANNSG
jgi:hypothetical protein